MLCPATSEGEAVILNFEPGTYFGLDKVGTATGHKRITDEETKRT